MVSQDGGPFSSSDNFGLICHINHAKNLLFITNDGGKGWKSSNDTTDEQYEFSSGIKLGYLPSSCWSVRVTWREVSRGKDQAVSKFNLHISDNLAISGDVSLNPGPSEKSKCSVCSRTLARNHRAVLCDCCKGLSHIKCAKVTPSEYKRIQDLPIKTWVCSACITISTHNLLPFHGIGNTTLEDLFVNEPAFMDYTDLIDSQDRDFASFMAARAKYSSNFLIAHLNINSY